MLVGEAPSWAPAPAARLLVAYPLDDDAVTDRKLAARLLAAGRLPALVLSDLEDLLPGPLAY